jgi:flagellar assembly factor FliW
LSDLTIESRRFGHIEARGEDLIHFDGLPGFERARRFVLLDHDRGSPFGWLVCVDTPDLGFVVTDPRNFFPDYRPQLAPGHWCRVEADEKTPLEMLAIVGVREGEVSLNLAAPLVVNPANRKGAQVILEPCDYSTRERLPRLEEADPNGQEPDADADPNAADR